MVVSDSSPAACILMDDGYCISRLPLEQSAGGNGKDACAVSDTSNSDGRLGRCQDDSQPQPIPHPPSSLCSWENAAFLVETGSMSGVQLYRFH